MNPGAGRDSYVQRSRLRTAPDFSTAAQGARWKGNNAFSILMEANSYLQSHPQRSKRGEAAFRHYPFYSRGGRKKLHKPQETSRGKPAGKALSTKESWSSLGPTGKRPTGQEGLMSLDKSGLGPATSRHKAKRGSKSWVG